jgi:hypothetical protein
MHVWNLHDVQLKLLMLLNTLEGLLVIAEENVSTRIANSRVPTWYSAKNKEVPDRNFAYLRYVGTRIIAP